MKVLKFGGTSVGSKEGLANLKEIVTSREEEAIVVVSALGGITNTLLLTSELASQGEESWKDSFNQIVTRHRTAISELKLPAETDTDLLDKTDSLLTSLKSLFEGVYTLKVLPEKTKNEIVSYGERLSSQIVNSMIEGSRLYDSLEFIRTRVHEGRTVLDYDTTAKLIKKTFSEKTDIAIVPGFISRDCTSGEITNLGRGGSDYTASILASVLGSSSLEIWTDVDGFMTADPRIIKTSYVIDELSFTEAMELCNFGAKVIYPPSLYPVCDKDIPIVIKNTFNPGCKGTTIRQNSESRNREVTGISSIDDTCIITVAGPSMAGIIGVDSRIFTALANRDISVFLVCQSSSETSIALGVKADHADLACELLNHEFRHEIAEGSMSAVTAARNMSTVAIVGRNMKTNSGIAGKLFTVLGRNGISVAACAQGTEGRSFSFVVERSFLRKTLNVIHDSFFLSTYQELNLFLCGTGTVGGQLIEQIRTQREKLMNERNLKLNVVGIIRRAKALFCREGICLDNFMEEIAGKGIPSSLETIRNEVIGMNIFNSVFVDCTASNEIAGLYHDFLQKGISVVAANKVAASSDYDNYQSLKTLARNRGVKFLFETNVGAGLPIINTINALVNSGDKIEKIEAVLSGTLNFICNSIAADVPFSQTVSMAKELGFSEPDPRIDLSGKDVIRKLVILAREAGYKVNQKDVDAKLFIPEELFNCSIEEFWARLPEIDPWFEKERKRLEAEHKRWRFVAKMENGNYGVALREFDSNHPFYELEGSNNIILLTTERYHQHPMLIQGYGAGAGVTAAGVFADIMSIANI